MRLNINLKTNTHTVFLLHCPPICRIVPDALVEFGNEQVLGRRLRFCSDQITINPFCCVTVYDAERLQLLPYRHFHTQWKD